MVSVRRAELKDVADIIAICSAGWQETYKDLVSQSCIDQVIKEYYNTVSVTKEVTENSPNFHGYWVAEKEGRVLGCIGGGIDGENAGHVYVFYVHPDMKGQGIGTALLNAFTAYQKETYGITEQWVTSLMEGNLIGQAFYEKSGFVFDYATEDKQAEHSNRSFHLKRPV